MWKVANDDVQVLNLFPHGSAYFHSPFSQQALGIVTVRQTGSELQCCVKIQIVFSLSVHPTFQCSNYDRMV